MKLTPRPALDGLSIGYRTRDFELHNGKQAGQSAPHIEGGRPSRNFACDVSNESARDRNSREGCASEIKTIREFEKFLRDVGGFSNAAAKPQSLASDSKKPASIFGMKTTAQNGPRN
jgi:hypothetical protein